MSVFFTFQHNFISLSPSLPEPPNPYRYVSYYSVCLSFGIIFKCPFFPPDRHDRSIRFSQIVFRSVLNPPPPSPSRNPPLIPTSESDVHLIFQITDPCQFYFNTLNQSLRSFLIYPDYIQSINFTWSIICFLQNISRV